LTEAGTAIITVIGCGNPNRSDDGVGPEVIRLLGSRRALQHDRCLQLLDAGTDGMTVMFAARGCTTLFLVDACRTGAEPGAVFEVPGSEVEAREPHSLGLHDFRWDHAIFDGRRIYADNFPSDVVVFLIEAHNVGFGIGLSPQVQEAALRVTDLIEQQVLTRRAHRPQSQKAAP